MVVTQAVHDHPVEMVELPGGPVLAYRRRGEAGIPVIFIHGYSMSLDCWDRVFDLLPAEYRGYAYDLRGFGRSGEASTYTLEDHAADLFRFMDAMRIDRAILIGHSLGSSIAQMAVTIAPQRVIALVIANGRARNLPAPDAGAARVRERLAAYGTAEQNRRIFAGRTADYFDPRNVTVDEIDRFIEIAVEAKTEALRQTLQALYTCRALTEGDFAAYRGPVLAIGGEADNVTPLAATLPVADVLPQTEFITLPGCGHSPMWETPLEWSQAVHGFLDRVSRG
jgi:pimeloyl-ACP methyl ester carboxylesterase